MKAGVLIIVLFSAINNYGQTKNYIFNNINVKDGLSHSIVTSITEDDYGFIWIGTQDGLNRYNGYEAEQFYSSGAGNKVSDSWVTKLYEDTHGDVWVCYRNGLLDRYYYKKDTFFHYTPCDELFNGRVGKCFAGDVNNITPIFYEDSHGNLWIGTQNGLNKYIREEDSFISYTSENNDPNTISDNRIMAIVEDASQNLWVGTQNGLNRFDTKDSQFKRFLPTDKANQIISDTLITALAISDQNRIIVGTQHDGLTILTQSESDTYSSQTVLLDSLNKNANFSINGLAKSSSGNIFAATNQGLFELETKADGASGCVIKSTLGYETNRVLEDVNGNIWCTVSGNILLNLNNKKKTINQYILEKNEPLISDIYQGRNSVLWIGTIKGGVYYTDLNSKEFNIIDDKSKGESIYYTDVYAIFKDGKGNLFIGTENGLNILHLATGQLIAHSGHQRKVLNRTYEYSSDLPFRIVGAINRDKKGNVWLGSYDYKLSRLSPESNQFLNFHYNELDPKSFKIWSVRAICVTKNGDVYFGGVEGGLGKLNKDGISFKYFPVVETGNPTGTNDKFINVIYEDTEGVLWIGTMNSGLNKFDPVNEAFTHYESRPENENTLSSNHIKSICEYSGSEADVIWVGTNRGLNKFYKNTGIAKSYDFDNKLINNVVHAILEGDDGNLWYSTNNGIVKFNPETTNASVYTEEDGLPGNEYNGGSSFKDESGTLYFGGTKGIVYFKPSRIKESTNNTESFIGEIFVNHNKVKIGVPIEGQIVLQESVFTAKGIELNHRHKTLSLGFGGVNYVASNKIRFKYMLEGFDEDWIIVDNEKRFADYTNLPSGHYNFKIVSTNSDGIWSDVIREIEIYKRPPVWRQTWFKISLFIALAFLVFSIIRIRTRVLRVKNEELEKKVNRRTSDLVNVNRVLESKQKEVLLKSEELIKQNEEVERQNSELKKQKDEMSIMARQLHETDQKKIQFFTNISHEIRTPLTLIMAPTEKLLKRHNYSDVASVREDVSLIYRNEKRLLNLINQVLDLRKLDLSVDELFFSEIDLVDLLNEISESFFPLACDKGVNIYFKSEFRELIIGVDKSKVEKVVFNLLSNALKYSKSDGVIHLSLSEATGNKQEICISVRDNGLGIPQDKLHRIFDRFYQIENENSSGVMSSGIGLSIVKDLVEKLNWRIAVNSILGEGTTFEIFIPEINQGSRGNVPFRENAQTYIAPETVKFESEGPLMEDEDEAFLEGMDKTFHIVLVEDNLEVLAFLKRELSVNFKISTATNGKEALELVGETMPDLIISDVMMPLMNGFDLCKTIKSSESTSHIGVFLLTAKVENESQILGLELGADDYILKPFSISVIKLRIRNLIRIREANRKIFNDAKENIPANINVRRIDQSFLENLVGLIEQNLDDLALSGDFLSDKLCLSKSHLYRKIKSLTGVSVNIFIRNIRLRVAARLLEKGDCSISEVAYSVGFSNPKYFSTCFAEMYSKTPTEYMVQNK